MGEPSGEKPRLGYLMPVWDPNWPGYYFHIPRLLAELSQTVDIDLIIWQARGELDLPGVRIHTVAPGPAPVRLWRLHRLVRRLVRGGCRRWYIRCAPLPSLAWLGTGSEVIHWVCGRHFPTGRWLFDTLVEWLNRFAFRRADRVATAPGMEESNRDWYGVPLERALLLNNDIDVTRFKPLTAAERAAFRAAQGVPEGKRLLLYVHALRTDRGADYLIPLLEACEAAGQDVFLLAVGGPGDQSEVLAAWAAAHPDRLRLVGIVPNAEMPQYFGAADLYLMPAQAEGFPRRVLESMACGTPLVSTATGCVDRVLPAAWLPVGLAPLTDRAAFIDKALALLADPAQAAEYAAALLARAGDYSVENVARQYAEQLTGPTLPPYRAPGEVN